MNFTISRAAFIEALQLVVNVIERKQTLPILSHVLVVAAGQTISLTATDQEVEVKMTVAGAETDLSITGEGQIAVPGRKLLDICKNLPTDSQIAVHTSDNRFTLSSGEFESQLATLSAMDFPNLEHDQDQLESFDLSTVLLKSMLEKTSFAMAQQDVRYFFNGMLFEIENTNLRLVATNGQRLAITETSIAPVASGIRAIVPRKGITELQRLIADSASEIKVSFTSNHMVALLGAARLTTKLIDAEYPDYSKAIPVAGDKSIQCSRTHLRDALLRTAILSNEVYKNVKLSMADGALELFTNNPLQEQATEKLSVSFSGLPLEIGFNVNFLIEALSVMSGETLVIRLSDATSPCLINDPDDKQSQYVISPMVV
jgi:DNA polymerase III subunit beta